MFTSVSIYRIFAEEFGAAAGDEKLFLQMLKTATSQNGGFGFLYIVLNQPRIRFFNSYSSEFVIKEEGS